MQWADTKNYPYRDGYFYIGVDEDGQALGIKSEKHAITVASARTGKDIAIITPNLLRWPHSALVVDTIAEQALATAEHRERMGQKVYVLDPFDECNVPDRFKARINPLANLTPNSPRIREDINVIADGLLMRHDPKSGHWDGGALSVIAGLIAHILTGNHSHPRTLATLREFMNASSDEFGRIVDEMQENPACGRLPQTAASKLTKTGNEAGHFLSGADENTKWLDSEPMANLLGGNECALSELKTAKTTIYLVLPSDLLEEHGRFLRLFVRMAISAMAKRMPNGDIKGEQCLFILNEFPALGHIGEISKAAGLMPGYGVHLWPFLQDLNQLFELYGHDGTHKFFGSADLHQFFGASDEPTLQYISNALGVSTIQELAETAPFLDHEHYVKNRSNFEKFNAKLSGQELSHRLEDTENRKLASQINKDIYDNIISFSGQKLMEPRQVANLIAKTNGIVANNSICFVQGRQVLIAKLKPYFEKENQPVNKSNNKKYEKRSHWMIGLKLSEFKYFLIIPAVILIISFLSKGHGFATAMAMILLTIYILMISFAQLIMKLFKI